MKIFFFLIVLLACSLNIYAGDYFLTISDDPSSICALEAKKLGDALSHPICSTQEIIADIERYFTGNKTELKIFNAVFTNARIKFCTPEGRHRMLIALVNVLVNPAISNEWDAYDYLFMLGTPKILDEIKERLHKEQSTVIQKRLERAKKSVERGLKERHII